MSFTILGTGSATPSLCKTNHDLAQMMDTSDDWIRTRTGIEQRYLCGEETITDLACQAAQKALDDAGIGAKDLDLILCATVTSDYITPSMACLVQERLSAGCPAFDVNAACTGFLYALDVADGYFVRGRVKNVLVIGAEAISKITDWEDRSTAVIFADGAGAAVLGEGDDLLSVRLTTKGNYRVLQAKNVKGNCPFRSNRPGGRMDDKDGKKDQALQDGKDDGGVGEEEPARDNFLYMDGQEVFRFAVASMVRDVKQILKDAGISPKDVSYVLPHQANMRIIDFAKSKLEIEDHKFLVNIHKRGNTSAAAIPVLLDEFRRKGTFKKGDILVLTAFGAGLTTAACAVRWGRD